MNKIALVTGYSSPLGLSTSQSLLSAGYQVYATVRDITAHFSSPRGLTLLKLDITDEKSCRQLASHISHQHQHLDVVVNIIGQTLSGPIDSFKPSDFSGLLATNTIGPYQLLLSVLPLLKKSPQATFINITSLNSFFANPNYSLYAASKYALQALGWVADLELSPQIRVFSVAPGAIASATPASSTNHTTARSAIPLLGWLLPLATPDAVVRTIVDVITNPPPAPVILVGRDAHLIYYLQKLLPLSIWYKLQSFVWHRQK